MIAITAGEIGIVYKANDVVKGWGFGERQVADLREAVAHGAEETGKAEPCR